MALRVEQVEASMPGRTPEVEAPPLRPERLRAHGERRAQPRSRRRIPCTLEGVRRGPGLTVDLSEDGLLLRTAVPLEPGTPVCLVLHSGVVDLRLRGRVVRRRAPPAVLGRLAAGGVAVALDAPPPAYLALLRAGR